MCSSDLDHDDNADKTPDEIELAMIDAGTDDFATDDRVWITEAPFSRAESVRSALEQAGVHVRESSHEYRATTTVILTETERATAEQIVDTLEEHDDVQGVFSNIQKE